MGVIQAASFLAPNMFFFFEAVSKAIQDALGQLVLLEQSPCLPLEDPRLLDDHFDLAFLCGLPFIQHEQTTPGQFRALFAPVMEGARYQNQPIYFSDVIVASDSGINTPDDLGGVFCYNDLGSNSGYNAMRYWLLQEGHTGGFFSRVIPSGAHQTSIQWIVERKADCAAIDSTVLEQALRHQPDLAYAVRPIIPLGPMPIPPLAISNRLSDAQVSAIRGALLKPSAALAEAMKWARIRRYEEVAPAHYLPLLAMVEAAQEAGFEDLD
jgi:phosphonate transport system substrate-binding protein